MSIGAHDRIFSDTLSVEASGGTTARDLLERRRFCLHITQAANTDTVGTIAVQVSNDGGTSWVALPFRSGSGTSVTSIAVASGTSANEIVEIETGADKWRVYYTRTSGGSAAQILTIRGVYARQE